MKAYINMLMMVLVIVANISLSKAKVGESCTYEDTKFCDLTVECCGIARIDGNYEGNTAT